MNNRTKGMLVKHYESVKFMTNLLTINNRLWFLCPPKIARHRGKQRWAVIHAETLDLPLDDRGQGKKTILMDVALGPTYRKLRMWMRKYSVYTLQDHRRLEGLSIKV